MTRECVYILFIAVLEACNFVWSLCTILLEEIHVVLLSQSGDSTIELYLHK